MTNVLVVGRINFNKRECWLTDRMQEWYRKNGQHFFPNIHLITEDELPHAKADFTILWNWQPEKVVVGVKDKSGTLIFLRSCQSRKYQNDYSALLVGLQVIQGGIIGQLQKWLNRIWFVWVGAEYEKYLESCLP